MHKHRTDNPDITTQHTNDMTELQNMMKDLISQMGTMMNLVSILINKLSYGPAN